MKRLFDLCACVNCRDGSMCRDALFFPSIKAIYMDGVVSFLCVKQDFRGGPRHGGERLGDAANRQGGGWCC